jgi:hypothetical protein
MPVGPWTIYDDAKLSLLNGTHDLDNDTFTMIPLDSTYTPSLAHNEVDDVEGSEVLNPGDDASLREDLAGVALVLDAVNHRVQWNADNVVIEAGAPVLVKYVALANTTNGRLIAYFDTDTAAGTGVEITQLTIQNPNGLLRQT